MLPEKILPFEVHMLLLKRKKTFSFQPSLRFKVMYHIPERICEITSQTLFTPGRFYSQNHFIFKRRGSL